MLQEAAAGSVHVGTEVLSDSGLDFKLTSLTGNTEKDACRIFTASVLPTEPVVLSYSPVNALSCN